MTSTPASHAVPGLWPSPIGADLVAAGSVPLSQPVFDGLDIYWLEGRPAEGGRSTLLRRRASQITEITPAPFNVRTRVHEYGGGAFHVAAGQVFFSNAADSALYVSGDGVPPRRLTDDGQRYADFVFDAARARLIAVREDHGAVDAANPYPVNTLCAVGLGGAAQVLAKVLAQGQDFYAAPRLSPDGTTLAWLSWDHPRMPWIGTELWVAQIGADGVLGAARLVAGGPAESVCQPEWSPSGELHFVSDRSGWWNLYREDRAGAVQALCPHPAEFGVPQWSFGGSLYGFAGDGAIVCAYIEEGVSRLARLADGVLAPIDNPYQEIRELRVAGDTALVLAGAPTIAAEIARIDLASGAREVLARSLAEVPDAAYLSVPESISYPSAGGRSAYAFYYPPKHADMRLAPDAPPPLMVIGHGGPTGMASSTLKLATQYWTSRGFAVLDVNYGGSSGFGRAYRDLLEGGWGVVDVEDCVAGARYLAERGLVDSQRLVIRGGSAGGLTTLCALAFHDVFKAGASYYGVADLKGLDQDSHKFESHYNAYLIAPQPQADALYRERSPSNHADKLRSPMIFFQGLDDKVVPPQQSQGMVDALRRNGVPVAYLTLEGEGHGFRKSESIVRTLEAELYFYRRVLGMLDASAAEHPAVTIENLDH